MAVCQLMVAIEMGAGAPARLAAALASARVASVVITVPEGAPAADVQTLIAAAQAGGAAALLRDDARLARTLKADGVHISVGNAKAFGEVREVLGSRAIVGVDAGRSRHEAMLAGEGGAEYVAVGIPAHVEDREKAHKRRCELVAWWSEIFEVPVVAFDVTTAEEAAHLASAGADFIALNLPAGEPPAASGELVRAAHAAIAGEEVV